MIQRIESIKNARVRRLISVHTPSKAKNEGVFCLEGTRAVSELCAPWQAESLWVSDLFMKKNPNMVLDLCNKQKTVWQDAPIYQIPDAVFTRVADTMNPQGIMAVVYRRQYSLGDLKQKSALWLVLENLQDPGNAGTIIRTADACNAAGILCVKGTVDFYNEKVIRAAMGSLLHIPFITVDTIDDAAKFVKEQNGILIGTYLKTEHSYTDVSYQKPTAILIGNEGSGMTGHAAELCSDLVKIPIPGRAESLNASVAAAVMMYEVLRQRK